MIVLKTQDLEYNYPGGDMIHFPDFSLEKGEHALVLGSSGSGKTTFLHLLGGLLQSRKGNVEILGVNWSKLSQKKRDQYRGQHMGFIFQTAQFLPSLNVYENLMMAAHLARKPLDKEWLTHLLEMLNLSGKEKRPIQQLSVGEQQRVAIARALVNRPEILLADEPTSALDDENCERVVSLLDQCAEDSGSSLLIVTHDNRLKGRYSRELPLKKLSAS